MCISIFISITIYIYVCVCVRVCVRACACMCLSIQATIKFARRRPCAPSDKTAQGTRMRAAPRQLRSQTLLDWSNPPKPFVVYI